MKVPKVSVVLPAYNAEAYIEEALTSLQEQSYKNFELIIINDGSTDKTESLIKLHAKGDQRIKLSSQGNQGLVAALNRGLELAKGEYVARMDADDVSVKDRFARQVALLDAHPEWGAVGSFAQAIFEDGARGELITTLWHPDDVKRRMHLGNPLVHGSIMLRKSALEKTGGYRKEEWPAEDYGLWLRLAESCAIANVPDVLYLYRTHAESISRTNSGAQEKLAQELAASSWSRLPLPKYGAIKTIWRFIQVRLAEPSFRKRAIKQFVSDQRELSLALWSRGSRWQAWSNALGTCIISPRSIVFFSRALVK